MSRVRNCFISLFAVVWILIFHYESIRYFYLNPLFKKDLPKLKFLFPPAGWIMFFNVDDRFGAVEVYGIKNSEFHLIDPHDIFRTRTIGFDNIHRGILGSAAGARTARPFCSFLRRRFPYYDRFAVTFVEYPSITKEPNKKLQTVMYQCVANVQ